MSNIDTPEDLVNQPGQLSVPGNDGQKQYDYQLTACLVQTRYPNGVPRLVTIMANDHEMDTLEEHEVILAYIPNNTMQGETDAEPNADP